MLFDIAGWKYTELKLKFFLSLQPSQMNSTCHSYSNGVTEPIWFFLYVQMYNSWIQHTHLIMKGLLCTAVC